MTSPPRILSVMALVGTVALAACGSSTDLPKIESITITPGSSTLVSLGETVQLTATAMKPSGGAVPTVSFSWSSSAPGVVSVNSSGLATAVGDGTATVTASESGGISGSATVVVAQEATAITVTLAVDTLTIGESAEAAADAVDSGGSALISPNLSWNSSDPTVATVDGNGIVTGLAEGIVGISASKDGATGTDSIVVVRPSLNLTADTVLGGSVAIGDLFVAAGVTVTLMSDLEIDVNGILSVAGTISGDCRGFKIDGEGSVTISGVVDNSCASATEAGEEAPAISIDLPGGVDLTDGTLVSSGPISVVSQTSESLPRPVSQGGTGRALAPPVLGTVNLEGATIRGEPTEVPQPESVEDSPPSGASFEFRAAFDLIIDGTTIRTQSGGPGVPVNQTSATDLLARGGRGGSGGNIAISIPDGGTIRFRSTRGRTQLVGGDGGPGGPATATTTENPAVDPAPKAEAVGGGGGFGGSVKVFGAATLQEGSDIGLIQWQVGIGGRGGNATAIGARGVDATALRAAQVGGMAVAEAGTGGSAGSAEGGFLGMPAPDGKEGGGGGIARATGGDGGDGVPANPDGALGGVAEAYGGRGGNSTNAGGREGGDAIADGGNGGHGADVCPASTNYVLSGQISVNSDPASSDPFIFDAGSGRALSLVQSILSSPGGPGGDGGGGALLTAVGGRGGFGREVQSASGVAAIGSGGNGGDGGAGIPGGSGGSAGAPGAGSDPDALRSNPIFQNGSTGGGCSSSLAGPILVFARAEGDLSMEISGAAPWVSVTGVLAEDGTVTGSGRGTVAGVPDILVEFAGTWDEATKSLQGTYTIDSEKVISAGHPVVYDVSVSGG